MTPKSPFSSASPGGSGMLCAGCPSCSHTRTLLWQLRQYLLQGSDASPLVHLVCENACKVRDTPTNKALKTGDSGCTVPTAGYCYVRSSLLIFSRACHPFVSPCTFCTHVCASARTYPHSHSLSCPCVRICACVYLSCFVRLDPSIHWKTSKCLWRTIPPALNMKATWT